VFERRVPEDIPAVFLGQTVVVRRRPRGGGETGLRPCPSVTKRSPLFDRKLSVGTPAAIVEARAKLRSRLAFPGDDERSPSLVAVSPGWARYAVRSHSAGGSAHVQGQAEQKTRPWCDPHAEAWYRMSRDAAILSAKMRPCHALGRSVNRLHLLPYWAT